MVKNNSIFIVLILLYASQCQADIYKRVDENGLVTYSNSPESGGKSIFSSPDNKCCSGVGSESDKTVLNNVSSNYSISECDRTTIINRLVDGHEPNSASTQIECNSNFRIKPFTNYRKSDVYRVIEKINSPQGKYETKSEFSARRKKPMQELASRAYLFPTESVSTYDADTEIMTFQVHENQSYSYPLTEAEISQKIEGYKKAIFFSTLTGESTLSKEYETTQAIVKGTESTDVLFSNIKELRIKMNKKVAIRHGDNFRIAIEGKVNMSAIPDVHVTATKMIVYDVETRRVIHVTRMGINNQSDLDKSIPVVNANGDSAKSADSSLRFESATDAWIQVVDGKGTRFSKLVRAGSTESLTGVPPFRLVVGEAALVKLTYNGNSIDLTPFIGQKVARLTLD